MADRESQSSQPPANQAAFLLLVRLLDRLGMSKRGFLNQLADRGYAYSENQFVSWGRPGRSFPRDWTALRAMIQVLTEHHPPQRRCTADEALLWLSLVGLPFHELQLLADTFEPAEWYNALSLYIYKQSPESVTAVLPSTTNPTRLTPVTRFIGRKQELQRLCRLIQAERLITILGPGGSGKTRLALQVAQLSDKYFADGAVVVPLASIHCTHLIAPALASAFHLSVKDGRSSHDQLLNHLRDKKSLLVLDNFEHLLEAIPLIAEILECAPHIRILVTSRERLQLHGELLFDLGGLSLEPDPLDASTRYSEAVQLFHTCAQRVDKNFVLNEAILATVIQICQILEGIPLGIELAAALVRNYDCLTILNNIAASRDFLNTTQQNVPERQRSLRAVFEHSWRLLPKDEQERLCYLGVFCVRFSLAAAYSVANVTQAQIGALVDKSLLRRNADGSYEFHSTIQQYVIEKLQADKMRWKQIHDAHAQYYACYMQERIDYLRGPAQPAALAELEAEIVDIRVGCAWVVSQQQMQSVSLYLRCLAPFYKIKSWTPEGIALFYAALELYERLDAVEQGVYSADHAFTLRTLASAYVLHGDYAHASDCSQQSLLLYRTLEDQVGIVQCLSDLGNIAYTLGAYSDARRYYQESLTIRRQRGDQNEVAVLCNNLGNVAYLQHDYVEAQQWLHEGLATAYAVGDQWAEALCLDSLGYLAYLQGQYTAATPVLEESLALSRAIGDQWGAAVSLINLGHVLNACGEIRHAQQQLHEALQIAEAIQAVPLVLEALVGIARADELTGHEARALHLLALAMHHPASERETAVKAARQWEALMSRVSPTTIHAAKTHPPLDVQAALRTVLAMMAK